MPCTNHLDVDDALALCVRCARPFCPSCHVLVGGLPYCATCKEQLVRDLRSGRDAIGLAIASPGRRFIAMIIDGLVLAIPVWILMIAVILLMIPVAGGGPDEIAAFLAFGSFLFQLVILAVSLFSGFLYEWWMLGRWGRTVGKMALRLKVVTPQGVSISGGQAAGRSAIKQLFGLLSCFGLINYVPAFFTPEATAVHDLVASTRVIEWEEDE